MSTVLIVANSSWNIVNFRSSIVEAFIAKGDNVVVVTPNDGFSNDIKALGCDFFAVPIRSQSRNIFFEFYTFLFCFYAILKFRPESCFTYTIKPNLYFGIVSVLFPVFRFFPNVAGLGSGFSRPNFFSSFLAVMLRFAFRRAECVFLQNSDDLQKLLCLKIVKPTQARLLPGSGVNTLSLLPHARLPRLHGHMNFLLAGRLLKSKGVIEYCEAAALLTELYPSVKFYLAGFCDLSNPDALSSDDILRLVTTFPVVFIGNYADVSEVMRNIDCVVLPSFYPEGTPRVLLEALALGKLIVTTDMPGCRDTVLEGVNGFLCEPRSSSSLFAALEHIVNLTDVERIEFGSSSRNLAVSRFDERLVVDAYLSAASSG